MPESPPLLVLCSLVIILTHPITRPCCSCTLLFLFCLCLPIYGGDTWARWCWSSILQDVFKYWQIDCTTGKFKTGIWHALQAWSKFLVMPRPIPLHVPPLTL